MGGLAMMRTYLNLTALILAMAAMPARAEEARRAPEKAVAAAALNPVSDWPQWRGPNRDGVAPASPKLLNIWPKEGPKQLWKSGPIPGSGEGGSGSVSVADGRAIVYVNWAHFEPKKVITTEYVTEWGWAPDMPAD